MKRREFMTGLCGATALPLAARAQQGGKVTPASIFMARADGVIE